MAFLNHLQTSFVADLMIPPGAISAVRAYNLKYEWQHLNIAMVERQFTRLVDLLRMNLVLYCCYCFDVFLHEGCRLPSYCHSILAAQANTQTRMSCINETAVLPLWLSCHCLRQLSWIRVCITTSLLLTSHWCTSTDTAPPMSFILYVYPQPVIIT